MIEGNKEEVEGTFDEGDENVNGNNIENGRVKEFGPSLNAVFDNMHILLFVSRVITKCIKVIAVKTRVLAVKSENVNIIKM